MHRIIDDVRKEIYITKTSLNKFIMASILGEYLNKRMGILELRRELSRLRHDYDKYTGRSLFIYLCSRS